MRQIFPHPLWLGHAGDGRDFRLVLDTGVQAVVQLAAEEPPLELPRELIYCRFPLLDGPGNDPKHLFLATQTVANLLDKRVPVLVCCGAGMSRSPAIAAAALAMVYRKSPDDCLKQVAEHHAADVVPWLWSEVKTFLGSESLGDKSYNEPNRKENTMSQHEADQPLSEERRQEIFLALVDAQDHEIPVPQSRTVIAQRFEITENQVRQIEREGLEKNWPPL